MNDKVIQGDCLEVMKDIEDHSVDVAIADPPYKMTKKGKSCRPNYMPVNMGDNFFSKGMKNTLPDTKEWLRETYRVLNNQSHLYIFTNTNSLLDFLNISKEVGFKLHNVLTMAKDTRIPSRWYYKKTELVLFMRKGKAKRLNNMSCSDLIEVKMTTKKNGKKHPTQKPLSLIEMFVKNSSNEGETVIDPFMGSGTTGVACKNLNRYFIGIELNEKYFEVAKKRIRKA